MSKKGLGKGLGALLLDSIDEEKNHNGIIDLKINDIEPDTNQPRKNFDDSKLEQLAESIKQHGVVQPIIVTKYNDSYKIVAGERRWRACRIAGISTVPAIVKELTDRQVMEIALIENLQREDLNPIEESYAYEKLIKDYNMTQEELSQILGVSRPSISNSLRLLSLPEKIKTHVINGNISSGHARSLLGISDKDIQEHLAEKIYKFGLSVRDTEKLVKNYSKKKLEPKKSQIINEDILILEEKLKNIFGTKVRLLNNDKKGKILIEYYSNDELERILDLVSSIEKR